MANEVAGIDILLYVQSNNLDDPPVWALLGGQRGMTLKRTTEVADAKHKSSGQWQNRKQTFLDWGVTGDMVKITGDVTQGIINTAWRARQNIRVRVLKEDGKAEYGLAVVADNSEQAPHDNVATLNLDLQSNGELFQEDADS